MKESEKDESEGGTPAPRWLTWFFRMIPPEYFPDENEGKEMNRRITVQERRQSQAQVNTK